MIAQRADLLRELRIAACHHSSIAECAEIFGGIERIPTRLRNSASPSHRMGRAERLGRVLKQRHPVLRRERGDARHVRATPVQMHGDDRFHVRRLPQNCCQRVGADVERHGIDVRENNPCSKPCNTPCGGEKSVRRRDHRVPRTNPEGHHQNQLGIRSG